ncbi:WD40 repeat domain-containing serine/threonine protein kinase [Ktedonobacter racemifer]|uniref:non-specific serine/threonine protein kinase n=1 Tax=Ktedonobacter racemifer DSM 44963 TaxID=485913 RepID=D6U4U9_KTERA|nr:WD40 repeat domain-containing serine/threonine protein kinase [Ktedonobacter racemifer]EFH81529.1 serine/threonine protein kinase with WD40 repeats [Ktedonobacter racemifer DSM 44963]
MKTDVLYCLQCGAANDVGQVACFACDQPLTDTVENEQPFLIHERYRLLSQLGTGGFGAVYKVADTHSNNAILALKQINLRGLSSQQVIEATDAFNREVALLSTLKHSNLPRVYHHFTDPEHWYLTMDFIDGETLEAYLERKDATRSPTSMEPLLPLPELLDIALQLCTVLHYLHTRQPAIIFRDLKPANIMLTTRRKLYLIDFGIARHFKPGQTRDTIPFGSPGYAAPEQYGKAQTSPCSDVYSLGALLHYLLSGIDPADNPFNFSPLRLTALPGATQLEDLVMSMVSLHPERRPASITLVEGVLREIASLQPTIQPPRQPIFIPPMASPPGSVPMPGMGQVQVQAPQLQPQPKPAKRLTRRSILGVAVAGTAVVVLGANLSKGLLPHRPQPQSVMPDMQQSSSKDTQVRFASFASSGKNAAIVYNDSFDVLAIDKASSTPTTPYQLQYAPYDFSLSPDGTHMLISDMAGYLSAWDVSTNTLLFSYPVFNAKGAPLTFLLAWSPDNRYFVGARGSSLEGFQNEVTVYEASDHGKVVRSYSGVQRHITSLTWSPNGAYIAAIGEDQLYVWDAQKAGDPLMSTSGSSVLASGHLKAWSPDSTKLACYDSGGNIQIWSLQDGKLQQQGGMSTQGRIEDLVWSPDGKYLVSANPSLLTLWDAQRGAMLDQKAMGQFTVAIYWPKDSQEIIILDSAKVASPIDIIEGPHFG